MERAFCLYLCLALKVQSFHIGHILSGGSIILGFLLFFWMLWQGRMILSFIERSV